MKQSIEDAIAADNPSAITADRAAKSEAAIEYPEAIVEAAKAGASKVVAAMIAAGVPACWDRCAAMACAVAADDKSCIAALRDASPTATDVWVLAIRNRDTKAIEALTRGGKDVEAAWAAVCVGKVPVGLDVTVHMLDDVLACACYHGVIEGVDAAIGMGAVLTEFSCAIAAHERHEAVTRSLVARGAPTWFARKIAPWAKDWLEGGKQ